MRIKSDFVTNSSSSAFLVAWPTEIKDLDDILKYIPEKEKAEQVFMDSMNLTPMIIDHNDKKIIHKISEEITYGYVDEIEDQLNSTGNSYDGFEIFTEKFMERHHITDEELKDDHYSKGLIWEEYENYRLALASKLAIKFCKENEGRYLYIYEYGDDSGAFFSEMEHGGTFNDIRHIHISKH